MTARFKEWLSYNRILQMILVTIAAVLCCVIWSKRVFFHVAVSKGNEIPMQYTGDVTMTEVVMQRFSPQKKDLREIAVQCRVDGIQYSDRVFMTVYDENLRKVCQEVVKLSEAEDTGMLVMHVQADLAAGQNYVLGLNAHYENAGTLQIAYAGQESLNMAESGLFWYAAIPHEDMQIGMSFRYETPYHPWWRVILRMAAVVFGAIGIWAFSVWGALYLKRKNLWYKARYAVLTALFVIVMAAELISVWFMCVKKVFGSEKINIITYALGAVVILALTVYAVYRTFLCKNAYVRRESADREAPAWRNYFQIVCVTVLIWACVYYINAEIQWKQDYARSWVFLLFGLFILFTLPVRAVFHRVNLIWGAVMLPLGIFWCRAAALNTHQDKITCALAFGTFVWGVVLLYLLRNLKKQKTQSRNLPFLLCWLLMCLLMIINRYGKMWPIFLTVTFTLFYLIPYTENERKQIMHNFMIGVFANFFWMLGESLCHRPFQYERYRYPMYFFTVGCTGMYLVMVEAFALVLLIYKIRRTGRVWQGAWKEWIFNGLVIAYINLTISRTAYMTLAGMFVTALAAAVFLYHPKMKHILAAGAVTAAILLAVFPVGYTLTRCIPAVINRPVEISPLEEDFARRIKRGDKPDSTKYIKAKTCLEVWFRRLGASQVFNKIFADSGIRQGTKSGERIMFAAIPAVSAFVRSASIEEMSNGRFDIFREYCKNLNLTGHRDMGIIMEDGHDPGHAHNTFLQNAYDYGIPAGLLYLGLILAMIGRSLYLMKTGKDRSMMQFDVLMILSALIFVSISEYCANPCYPLGFASFFVLFTMRREKTVV